MRTKLDRHRVFSADPDDKCGAGVEGSVAKILALCRWISRFTPLSTFEVSDNYLEPTSRKARYDSTLMSRVEPRVKMRRSESESRWGFARVSWMVEDGWSSQMYAGAVHTYCQTFNCMGSEASHWTISNRSLGLRNPSEGLCTLLPARILIGVGPNSKEGKEKKGIEWANWQRLSATAIWTRPMKSFSYFSQVTSKALLSSRESMRCCRSHSFVESGSSRN